MSTQCCETCSLWSRIPRLESTRLILGTCEWMADGPVPTSMLKHERIMHHYEGHQCKCYQATKESNKGS